MDYAKYMHVHKMKYVFQRLFSLVQNRIKNTIALTRITNLKILKYGYTQFQRVLIFAPILKSIF